MPTTDPRSDDAPPPPRIEALGDALADQIAAGEVVERPASVVKELLENAIDAGARRVRIELTEAGTGTIVVIDDGCGIVPEDLALAVTRHATSKVRTSEDLVEIGTLGFRGEALASMAAVAHVRIRSRPRGASRGVELRSHPGLPPERSPVGMPVGTRVELHGLFGNVPARRKFLRSEATELGHVSQTVLRVALVQPQVHITVHHGSRRLLELPAGTPDQRVAQVLSRGHGGGFRFVEGEHDGVAVRAWLGPADAALRNRGGLYVVVRRRVVREPNIAKIVSASYGDTLEAGRHPVACVVVDPARGEVDVNVHPQKSEIRFGEPQRVYSAVRQVLGTQPPALADEAVAAEEVADLGVVEPAARAGLGDVLDRWAQASSATAAQERSPGYRLRTRAADRGYSGARSDLRAQAEVLGQAWRDDRAADPPPPQAQPAAPVDPAPQYVGCLPGPVGLFIDGGDLLVIDLRALRSFLVLRRLRRDIGGGDVVAQSLLEPVVVRLPEADVANCVAGQAALGRLGLYVEAFGEDAVIVRAVPASLRQCVEQPDVADLVVRVLPWLRVRAADAEPTDAALVDAMQAMAQTTAPDPAPRLARRWLRDLLDEGVVLDDVPGLQRWSAAALTRSSP